MDITNIQYPDDAFDIIICNHVLEHVPDDIKAMCEFYRVLKSGGWAILNVPKVVNKITYEDDGITDDVSRFWAYGQIDHVRIYGSDYVDRLRSVGFDVKEITCNELATDKDIDSMRLKADMKTLGFLWEDKITFCKK